MLLPRALALFVLTALAEVLGSSRESGPRPGMSPARSWPWWAWPSSCSDLGMGAEAVRA